MGSIGSATHCVAPSLRPVYAVLGRLDVDNNEVVIILSLFTMAQAVIALASLLAPLHFSGDLRPYMTATDKDAKFLGAAAAKKQVGQGQGQG